jgi:polar amino acid transport system substrate-binding protein
MATEGITITDERKQQVDFSDPYITVEQALLVRSDETRFKDAKEFAADKSLKVGTQPGTTNYDVAKELFGEDRIAPYDTLGVTVQALIAGDIDAVIMDNVAGQGYVGVNADKVKIIDSSLRSDPLGFIFKKGSDLTAAMNAGLKAIASNGTAQYNNDKWFKWFAPALPDLGGKKITIAVENAYPPFNTINQTTNVAEGWDYDVLNEVCKRLNCTPDYVESAWDGMIIAVSKGEYDMAADGITITEERKSQVDFSIGYVQVEQVLLVRAGESRFKTPTEFAADESYIVGTQPGTTNYDMAVKLVGESRIKAYDSFPVAVQALIAGDVDAVEIDSTAGLGYTGVNKDKVEIITPTLQSDYLGFIFPKGSELPSAISAGIVSMMNDGSLEEINGKWFKAVE